MALVSNRPDSQASAPKADPSASPNETEESGFRGRLTWEPGDATERTLAFPTIRQPSSDQAKPLGFFLSQAEGTSLGSAHTNYVRILDDDGPGSVSLLGDSVQVKPGAKDIVLTVRRSLPTTTALTITYATVPDTAIPVTDYQDTHGVLEWAAGDLTDRQITVPISTSGRVKGARTFAVQLAAENENLLGRFAKTTVTITDTPFHLWLAHHFPALVPAATPFSDYPSAVSALAPLFYLRSNESTRHDGYEAVDGYGQRLFTAEVVGQAFPGLGRAVAGPRPPQWLGLEHTNAAISFSPSAGRASALTCGSMQPLSARLGTGFTVSAFVRTTEDTKVMALLGGQNAGKGTQLQILLNSSARDPELVAPDHIRIVLRSESGRSLSYSVRCADVPTGKLSDGQWHHLTITVPPCTFPTPPYGEGRRVGNDNTDYARFYFDGVEAHVREVRGGENLRPEDSFAAFAGGLIVGATSQPDSAEPTLPYTGEIDELAIFPRALSNMELARMLHAQAPPASPTVLMADASPAGDGISNLEKYALGLDPRKPATRGLPVFTRTGADVEFSFTRRRDAVDILYRVERTTDQSTWQEIWSSTDEAYPGQEPQTTVTLRRTETDPRVNYRLRITTR